MAEEACSNAEWGPINRGEIISHTDTPDLPFIDFDHAGDGAMSSTVKCETGFLLYSCLLFSPLTATAGRDFANTVNCGQKLYSPCFIDLTILS